MSANATGTPTSPDGLLKFNTSVDKPNGLGINEMMDQLQVALNTKPKVTTSTLSGGPPGSPADKDIWVATAVDGAGARWTFQYNSGSGSAYKWEFLGGSPLVKYTATDQNTASGTMVDLGTVDNLTVTRGGDYNVYFGANAYSNTANDNQWQVGLFVNAVQVYVLNDWSTTLQWANKASDFIQITNVGAGVDVRLKYASPTVRNEHFLNRFLNLYPIRVA